MNRHPISNRKGFTLAELLIVVAIIAVLVAIAIPIFRVNLEKSREAHDIYTMRQAASAAIELYYAGVHDETSASKAGMKWWKSSIPANTNAAGAYDPSTGKFKKTKEEVTAYGKGTTINGGTTYVMGNPNGAYLAGENYTNAVVMVSIYPNASPSYAMVYWKNNRNGNDYVGKDDGKDRPKYSIKINLE